MKLDAHCHTDCSDGCLSIEDRIKMIREIGFDAGLWDDDLPCRKGDKR